MISVLKWSDYFYVLKLWESKNRKKKTICYFQEKRKEKWDSSKRVFFYSVADWQRSMLLSSCLLD